MLCPNCKYEIPDNSVVCGNCGMPLTAVPPQYAEQVPQYAEPLPQYAEPVPQPVEQTIPVLEIPENKRVVPTAGFFWSLVALNIPLVGFILMLVWSFSSNVNKNRRNLARAFLVFFLIWLVLTVATVVLALTVGAPYIRYWQDAGLFPNIPYINF